MFPIRDDRPHFHTPIVILLLIALNAMVFLHEMQLDPYSRNYFIAHYGIVPDRLTLTTLVTSQFLHGGWWHIVGNMLFLWAFGRSLEELMGGAKFLVFYLLCGVAAGLTQAFFNAGSHVPTVGASGAIAGIMGAYLIKFPAARIYTLVFFLFIFRVEVPALFFLPYWFITQVFNGVGAVAYSHLTESGTAWWAHIGGFIAGILLISFVTTQSRYTPSSGQRRRMTW